MISRRSFLKLAGVTAVAVGAGAGTGRLFNETETRRFAIHGFVPDNSKLVTDVLKTFIAELPNDAYTLKPVIDADSQWKHLLGAAFRDFTASSAALFSRGSIVIRLKPLDESLPADVLVYDDRKNIYRPESDFNGSLSALRSRLHGSEARYQISAEYIGTSALASLLSAAPVLVVENEDGIVDRIDMNKHRKISIPGPLGPTGVTINDFGVHVHSSTCRHALCKRRHATQPGDMIACAPNRILLRVTTA